MRRQEADPATLAELASKSGNPPYAPQHTIGPYWATEKEMVKDGQRWSKVAEQTSEISKICR